MNSRTSQEDPQIKLARERERRLAETDRTDATQKLAAGGTADYRRLFGSRFSLFDMVG